MAGSGGSRYLTVKTAEERDKLIEDGYELFEQTAAGFLMKGSCCRLHAVAWKKSFPVVTQTGDPHFERIVKLVQESPELKAKVVWSWGRSERQKQTDEPIMVSELEHCTLAVYKDHLAEFKAAVGLI